MNLIAQSNDAILQTYKRFPVVFDRGQGSILFDTEGTKYIDCATGIAVTCLGHAHPKLLNAVTSQASKLLHVSNLYHTAPQIALAHKLKHYCGGNGRIFFSNSGAEANECLIKLARKFGSSSNRHEIITAKASFHGRTMATLSATGKAAIQEGFQPLLPGFSYADFNDVSSFEKLIGPKTAAILIEGIQGEGGVNSATPEFLLGIRELCNAHEILLLWDGVQCGLFRTGAFHSFESILGKNHQDFYPDAISMAKSLGAGLPIGATWISEDLKDVLNFGSHGSTFGGNPLCTTVALKTIEVIEEEKLVENIRSRSLQILQGLEEIKHILPRELITEIRGKGLLIGVQIQNIEVPSELSHLSPASYLCYLAFQNHLLLVPAGDMVVRFLPAYNISEETIRRALEIFKKTILYITTSN